MNEDFDMDSINKMAKNVYHISKLYHVVEVEDSDCRKIRNICRSKNFLCCKTISFNASTTRVELFYENLKYFVSALFESKEEDWKEKTNCRIMKLVFF